MTNLRSDLEAAAFWDSTVCLDCDAILSEKSEDEVCPDCGGNAVYSCALVLRCVDAVESE